MIKSIELKKEDLRFDVALTQALVADGQAVSRSEVRKWIDAGYVLVGGEKVKSGLKLDKDLVVDIAVPDEVSSAEDAQDIPLDIVYEDDDLLVVNKAKGLVVHPAPGHASGTLVNALLYHYGNNLSDVNGSFRPGIIHRLDKDTSGLLVVAKNNVAHRRLAADLSEHKIVRTYIALVYGEIPESSGIIDAPIGRDSHNRQKMAIREDGKLAKTHFEVLERFPNLTLLKLVLETGRTHQIRVHLKFINHPVVADPIYAKGRKDYGIVGQMLHATAIAFDHPSTGEPIALTAPLPEYFESFLNNLRGK